MGGKEMAAAASAPPPQTSHTIETARPAGLGGAATPGEHSRLPMVAWACHGPSGSNLGAGTSNRNKNRSPWRDLAANEERQPLTYTQSLGVAEEK